MRHKKVPYPKAAAVIFIVVLFVFAMAGTAVASRWYPNYCGSSCSCQEDGYCKDCIDDECDCVMKHECKACDKYGIARLDETLQEIMISHKNGSES